MKIDEIAKEIQRCAYKLETGNGGTEPQAVAKLLKQLGGNLLNEVDAIQEMRYFYEGDGSSLDSEKISQEVLAHMSQTGNGFQPSHSNAHLIAAMSIALDWIGKATARELPTVHLLAQATRKLGTNQQGH